MWKSHKTIAQINRTNESNKMMTQDKMTSHPRMEMTNKAFRCSRSTQVHMEDLRLVNLTENHPSQKGRMIQGSLLMLWMDENMSQQSNKNH